VSITAELIAARRHAERALPHMSWFHRQQRSDSLDPGPEIPTPNDKNSV
jgi:hypothetical protein